MAYIEQYSYGLGTSGEGRTLDLELRRLIPDNRKGLHVTVRSYELCICRAKQMSQVLNDGESKRRS